MGLMGFRNLKKRTKVRIPARAILPWLAAYSWYILMYLHIESAFLIQLFHALQYLIFPYRVELNRKAEQGSQRPAWLQVSILHVSLVGAGLMVFWLPEYAGLVEFTALLGSLVNTHHYFVDGCIWKISNPDVRKDLFGHLQQKTQASP